MIRSREARRRAQALLELLHISEPPTDLDIVSERLGFEIIPYDFPDDISAVLMIEDTSHVGGCQQESS